LVVTIIAEISLGRFWFVSYSEAECEPYPQRIIIIEVLLGWEQEQEGVSAPQLAWRAQQEIAAAHGHGAALEIVDGFWDQLEAVDPACLLAFENRNGIGKGEKIFRYLINPIISPML
jgi:hypothetical protein